MSFSKSSAFSDIGHVAIVEKVTSTTVTVVGENQNGVSPPYTAGEAPMIVGTNDWVAVGGDDALVVEPGRFDLAVGVVGQGGAQASFLFSGE